MQKTYETGQRVTVTRGQWRGYAGTVTTHAPGSARYGVKLDNGVSADYTAAALKPASASTKGGFAEAVRRMAPGDL